MTIREASFFLLNQLRTIYPEGEAGNITDWVMEHITGSSKTERMLYKNEAITADEERRIIDYSKRLLQQEPVQYILQEAWFYGNKFFVNKNVLIPRPETEELVEWIIGDSRTKDALTLLDIGTGSGCIPITLKKKLPQAAVSSCDISKTALLVAQKNATNLSAAVSFYELDFLNEAQRNTLGRYDTIVSNPPYIPVTERTAMPANVVVYEPALALFVPEEAPLIFYTAIAGFGKTHLKPGGTIYLEVHESLAAGVITLFEKDQYKVLLKKDMQGKDRMIKAWQ